MRVLKWTLPLIFVCGACTEEVDDDEFLPGVDILGHATHSLDSVIMELVADDSDGLTRVMDLEFNPEVDGELWTVNATDDSVVILHDATSAAPTVEKIIDPYALHFMDEVSAISFGKPGYFATTQESDNDYNGADPTPNDFMGPTLWKASAFGESNPDAVEYMTDVYGFYTDLGSHYDMLHDSPMATGIEWSHENAYWVFDGDHEAISLQDFKVDHGMGYDDHSDGEILRYVEGEVDRANGVHSGMVLDKDTELLYIADSGNGRIAVLDTTSGTKGGRLPQCDASPYPVHNRMDDAVLTTLVDEGLERPSGLVRYGDLLLVADNMTGIIHAYTLEGEEMDYLDTELGQKVLQGMRIGPDGALYVATGKREEVLRILPNPSAF
jgi:hypothetical protein